MTRSWLALILAMMAPFAQGQSDPLPVGSVARLGTPRWRHGGVVLGLAYSPDGKSLASASRDGSVRLWETASGKELRSFLGHKGDVLCVAFAPDGKTLASGGSDGTVRLWNPSSSKEHKPLLEGLGRVHSVVFDPKGKRLAAGTDSGFVHLWDMSAERESGRFEAGEENPHLAFTPDGEKLLVHESAKTGEGGVELRRLPSGELVRRFGKSLHDFAISPDGKSCAVATYQGRPVIHDLETGLRSHSMSGDIPEVDRIRLVYSPDGRTLAAGSLDGTVRTWDAASGKLLTTFRESDRAIYGLAFSPDGKTLASARSSHCITLSDATTGKPLPGFEVPVGPMWSVAVSPDGSTVATAGSEGNLQLWESASGKVRARVQVPLTEVSSVAWSPDGRIVALGDERGYVFLIEAATRKLRFGQPAHLRRVTGLSFSPNGQTLASCSTDRTLILWDPRFLKEVRRFETRDGAGLTALAFSGDGNRLVSGGNEARLRLWDAGTGKAIREFEGHTGGTLGAALSPDGRRMLSGGRDSMMRLWESASGKERRALSAGGSWVWSVAWSRDGQWLASGHADGRICLWDAFSGLRLRELMGHRGAVLSLAFSRDGSRLISGGADTTGLIWDTSALRTTRPEPIQLSAEKTAALWEELASSDAPAAAETIQTLARAGDRSVTMLREHVKPVSESEVAGLLRDLDADRFAVRERAVRRLTSLGRFIEGRLREELSNQPTLEVRRRGEQILAAIARDARPTEEVRLLRALEVLEMIGTAAAKDHLKELADGAVACDLTREAKGALERLTNRR